MNGILNPIFFYPTAICLILFGILTIKFKNIFYSLLSAIIVFFLAGLLFYILGSEYNAVIQIAVYGIAIPVIFGLAIMFTNHKSGTEDKEHKLLNLNYPVFLAGSIFILATVYLVMTSLVIVPDSFNFSEQTNSSSLQVIYAISNGFFVRYVWAFELVSLILTIIIVGITMFKRINLWK